MPRCAWGRGMFSLAPEQGEPLIPLLLPLQNGYINFDKRRKVRGVWGWGWVVDFPLCVPRKGEREVKSGALSFGSCSLRAPSQEFAILSELLRLQKECRGYDLRPNSDIQQWLQGLQPLTEAQR